MENNKSEEPDFSTANFLLAAHELRHLPEDSGAEVAFVGRSNAGKSSALNRITGKKGLARTSKSPGRTREIVFFTLDAEKRLVDLPGYGYAKTPKSLQQHWGHTLPEYLATRRSLRALIIVADARHGLKDSDRDILAWSSNVVPIRHLLLTKADKLSRSKAARSLEVVDAELQRDFAGASAQLFSATANTGVQLARNTVWRWLTED